MNKFNKEELNQFEQELIQHIKKQEQIKIPSNLSYIVNRSIEEGKETIRPKFRFIPVLKAATICMALFIFVLNTSSVFAKTMFNLPIIGEIVQCFVIREFHFEDEIEYVDAKIPEFINTGKSELEKRVNHEIQYLVNSELTATRKQVKEYYQAFIDTGGDANEFKPVGISIDYKIHCMNEEVVSFSISKYETQFNAYNNQYYYNIDMESGRYLTIKDYLGNDYKEIIEKEINQQISSWSEEEKNQIWKDIDINTLIKADHPFYINEDKKPVIVFEKYEIATGSAGSIEFVIENM